MKMVGPNGNVGAYFCKKLRYQENNFDYCLLINPEGSGLITILSLNNEYSRSFMQIYRTLYPFSNSFGDNIFGGQSDVTSNTK